VEVRDRNNFGKAFSSLLKEHAGALLVLPAILFARNENQIADLAIKSRLPTIFHQSRFAELGGLMTYGPSVPELWRRVGALVGKVLNGSKPADLPVEQPTKFEFVINLKTAKQIGLTIPPNVLARADRVIR
jgi:putative tryptophan/tyrosine transport system substrate-binding protein